MDDRETHSKVITFLPFVLDILNIYLSITIIYHYIPLLLLIIPYIVYHESTMV